MSGARYTVKVTVDGSRRHTDSGYTSLSAAIAAASAQSTRWGDGADVVVEDAHGVAQWLNGVRK